MLYSQTLPEHLRPSVTEMDEREQTRQRSNSSTRVKPLDLAYSLTSKPNANLGNHSFLARQRQPTSHRDLNFTMPEPPKTVPEPDKLIPEAI
jgi:hypothetical protein